MDVMNSDTGTKQENEHGSPESKTQRYPIQLRGRGGFGHGRTSGRGHGQRVSSKDGNLTAVKPPSKTPSADPVDALATSMSALQFVPPSVRAARGRGRGRGG